MLETIFFGICAVAILFLILAIYWRSLLFSIIDTILWLVLAIAVHNLERPYQYSQGGQIYHAVHTIESGYLIAPLFLLMCLIMMIHTWLVAFDLLRGRKPKFM